MGRGGAETNGLDDVERISLDTFEDLSAADLLATERPPSSGLALISASDWFAIYRDGDLDYQGDPHDEPSFLLTNSNLLDPDQVAVLEPSSEWMRGLTGKGGNFPAALGDVVVNGEFVPLRTLVASSYDGAMAKEVAIVETSAEDWFGLYKNGIQILQGHLHDFDLPLLVEKLGIPCFTAQVDEKWLRERGRLPDKLADVKLRRK